MTLPGSGVDERAEHVVSQAADVLIVSQSAGRLAEALGFGEQECSEIVLVARELASNIVKHAGSGVVTITAMGNRLRIEARDRGPGIADVRLAVSDGFSTAGSLGYGLGTVNRLMDEMVIDSVRGEGTTVTAHRDMRTRSAIAGTAPFDVGVATAAKPGFDDNGDSYVVRSWDHHVLVGVIDGVGHGPLARQAAQAARRYVESHEDQPLSSIFRGTDVACRGTRGVVMALARFDWEAGSLEFASIGNIEARVFGARLQSFVVRRGILGLNAPAAKSTVQPWPPQATLVLHSDGIPLHWPERAEAALDRASASEVAHALLHELGRGTDDATVLVVRQARAGSHLRGLT